MYPYLQTFLIIEELIALYSW